MWDIAEASGQGADISIRQPFAGIARSARHRSCGDQDSGAAVAVDDDHRETVIAFGNSLTAFRLGAGGIRSG